MTEKLDLTGLRFGRLKVLGEAEPGKRGSLRWHCRCDCGRECTVLGSNLRSGHTTSCGRG